jgi:hypothetical protein
VSGLLRFNFSATRPECICERCARDGRYDPESGTLLLYCFHSRTAAIAAHGEEWTVQDGITVYDFWETIVPAITGVECGLRETR